MTNPWAHLSQINPRCEDGHTQIPNDILEELAKTELSVGEIKVCLFVIRKTWGFQKVGDALAVSTFSEGTDLTERAVKAVLSRLRMRRILLCQPSTIMRKGTHLNEYGINKHFDTWLPKGVNGGARVNDGVKRGERRCPKGVNSGAPTKEITKETKERSSRTKRDTNANPDHAELVRYWHDSYEKRFGVKYDFQGGKDGKIIKTLLTTFDPDQLKAIINDFLASDDEWVQTQGGYTIGILKTQANKIAQQLGGQTPAALPQPVASAGRCLTAYEEMGRMGLLKEPNESHEEKPAIPRDTANSDFTCCDGKGGVING